MKKECWFLQGYSGKKWWWLGLLCFIASVILFPSNDYTIQHISLIFAWGAVVCLFVFGKKNFLGIRKNKKKNMSNQYNILNTLPPRTLITNKKYEVITLLKNKPNERSLIATYKFSKSCKICPDDEFQRVFFLPFTKEETHPKNFVSGDFEVIFERYNKEDRISWRLFVSHTEHLFDTDFNVLKNTQLQRWHHKFYPISGDIIEVYFTSEKVFEPKNSVLEIIINYDVTNEETIKFWKDFKEQRK